MKIEEMVIITITPPSKRKRKELNYWDLDKPHHAELKAAIEKCLATGEEQLVHSRSDSIIYFVRPEFPLIESAMAKPENQSLLKVSIAVYHAAFYVGVRL